MTDYTELVKALRTARTVSIAWKGLMNDAAAAIEDLQAELEKKRMADCWGCKCEKVEPKRGEWIVKGANRIDCSVCGHSMCFAFGLSDGSFDLYKYCPECGAKMEVQDG